MNFKARWLLFLVYPFCISLLSLVPSAAHADFFDDLRRTFQTDIPHFFQDDIPCAFGGGPTSGTKKSCKDGDHAAKPPKNNAPAPAPDKKNKPTGDPTDSKDEKRPAGMASDKAEKVLNDSTKGANDKSLGSQKKSDAPSEPEVPVTDRTK